ncbi:MAG: 1-(5-phosphoribosyl)-5-[(5-phosphoribosylamino)methylideneamino]imidazole-4-carboxamide isomerase [Chloroflexi bacterium]|nr:1-(5-phosphoribosyl)-5-[(5-phosphoribosylamino)methylideneamino]imidazole-4-carboxamide isomerase [Chloroflexota bacterium]
MEIIPAVDIRRGKVVRLYQGDYGAETVFSDEPLQVALRWQSLGAPRVHVVDLDGAVAGELRNMEVIQTIASALLVPVQVGGGIREMSVIEQLLKAGTDRVVIGTAAVENPRLVEEAVRRFGESIAIGIDAREGKIAVRGWQEQTEQKAIDFARSMIGLGVRRLIYTDISRDGTLTEPNFTAIFELVNTFRVPIIAAGGISSINHLKMLKQLGAAGAIIGRALFTGDIDLKQALAVVNS